MDKPVRAADFDMNLIKVLHALFEERSVTRAGQRLGRTQSAVSNSLRRLRAALDDPLFVPGRHGLELTPKAQSLETQVRQIVEATDLMLSDGGAFDPAIAVGRCRIGAPDRLSLPFLRPLLTRLRQRAPNLALDVVTADREQSLALLDADQIDLAIGWFERLPARFRSEFLFKEGFVCLCRQDHPVLEDDARQDLGQILAYQHVMVSAAGDPRAAFDLALAQLGRRRNIMISLTNFSMAPHILRETDMLGIFTERAAQALAQDSGLTAFALPIAIRPLDHFMAWRSRADADPQQAWIREQAKAAVGET